MSTANICMCGYGIYVGWFSPTLVLVYQSNETQSPLLSGELSTADASWIGSVLCLGTAAGTLIFGYLANYTGTKDSLSYCSFLLMVNFRFTISDIKTGPIFWWNNFNNFPDNFTNFQISDFWVKLVNFGENWRNWWIYFIKKISAHTHI